ncbi:MAG: DnaJ domain-containing protein [Deferrisomatales bacterium]|nr:DnaJ domain-containing protein [Deferrisomatales bacterium]
MHTDLYQLLGVAPGATTEEIRRSYRKKAFELHPDRHGGSPEAEEAFKDLTAAYAVLGDAARRSAYDAARAGGRFWDPHQGPNEGASVNPEDLFRGMFQDPAFRSAFEQMAREFSSQGLRFDEAYLKKLFTGSRGPIVFGGVFFAGSLGGLLASLLSGARPSQVPPGTAPRQPLPARKPGLLRQLFGAALPAPGDTPTGAAELDVTYSLPVPAQTLADGGRVKISLPDGGGRRTYQVQVPPGSRPGTRLRLGGKGGAAAGRRGDLLLELIRAD